MIEIKKDVVLAPYTSWQVGGPAQFFCQPSGLDELRQAQEWASQKNLPMTILGGGSNVLIADTGISGLVICLSRFTGTETRDENDALKIVAWSGTSKSELLKIFLKRKLAPALFLAGLPGDIGGGVVMNAGVGEAFTPREFVEIIDWVEILRPDGTVERKMKSQLQWDYRHSSGWQPGIVVRVEISWPLQPDPTILDQVKQANKIRLSKQPLDKPSCGSVFINPPGHKAAQLIDSCGLKGYTVGGAQVSLKHANFIVNLGQATAENILQIIEHVQSTVFSAKNIKLHTEVVRLGFSHS